MSRTRALAALFLLVALGVALFLRAHFGSVFELEQVRVYAATLAEQAAANPLAAIAVYFGLYVLISVAAFFPAAIALNLVAGAVFGVPLGALLVSVASACAATLVFATVRVAFRAQVQARFGKQLATMNRELEQHGAVYVWLVRLTPIFPFAVVNVVMALTPVRLSTFFAVSAIGMLPASAAYALFGAELRNVESFAALPSVRTTLALGVLGLLPVCVRLMMGRLANKAHPP